MMFYYTFLIIIGNDIMPQTNNEKIFLYLVALFGACLISIIFGGIASEMAK